MTNNPQLITGDKNRNSFTLIELLVVLALVAILSVVVILTLNPAELIKQARDSNRLSDLSTINTALNLFSADVTGGFMGTSTNVYVSIPSTLSDCSNLGLPTLPAGYAYSCVTSAVNRNTDGTGWIPVNFQRISSNSPISQLPVDPINTTSTRLYYTYIPGGSWELSSGVEASKNKLGGSNDLTSKDGGNAISLYEAGNNLTLNPIDTGDTSLVGYWNFEEGPTSTVPDKSGYGSVGIWIGTSTQLQHYASGRVGNYAGWLNGSSDYVDVGNKSILNLDNFTYSLWIKSPINSFGLFGKWGATPYYYVRFSGQSICTRLASVGSANNYCDTSLIPADSWTFISVSIDLASLKMNTYINGAINSSISISSADIGPYTNTNTFNFGDIGNNQGMRFAGQIDDLRVYNRALSAAEILAIYNATK